MKKSSLIRLALQLILPGFAFGANSAIQTISVTVLPATAIVLTGEDPNFQLLTQPLSGEAAGSKQLHTGISYSITSCDDCAKKIVGQLDMNMPEGTELKVYFSAPSGATSTGFQPLSIIEKDLVIHIQGSSIAKNSMIIYEISVDPSVTSLPTFSRNVIYTFIDE